ncbi:unnamed protein product [Phytophthora fragariaefolia]|uniref:Unnamed protein product n=1 Tax=Phytophthora fragariaefolia TaxID=1490495 RepID=A0A9W6U6R5_9STRA|nr:unnamed protein product [Phytophthora fragariaefolia]
MLPAEFEVPAEMMSAANSKRAKPPPQVNQTAVTNKQNQHHKNDNQNLMGFAPRSIIIEDQWLPLQFTRMITRSDDFPKKISSKPSASGVTSSLTETLTMLGLATMIDGSATNSLFSNAPFLESLRHPFAARSRTSIWSRT